MCEKTTHYDDRCVASCVAITTIISLLLREYKDVEQIKWQAFKIAEMFTEHKQLMKDHLFVNSFAELNLEDEITRGFDFCLTWVKKHRFTFKTTATAFCALSMLKTKSFEQIIEELVREAGDADTYSFMFVLCSNFNDRNAAVCGAVLGCCIGYSNLPKHWLNGLIHKDWLMKKVELFIKS